MDIKKLTFNERLKLYIAIVHPYETQEELAKMIDIGTYQFSRYLTGTVSPSVAKLVNLEKLGASFAWLIHGSGFIFALNKFGDKAIKKFTNYYNQAQFITKYTNNLLADRVNDFFGGKDNFCKLLDQKGINYEHIDIDSFFNNSPIIDLEVERILTDINFINNGILPIY